MLKRDDLLFPELSYKILGCAFSTYNELGPGRLEKVYQKALAKSFEGSGLKFQEQFLATAMLDKEALRTGYADFLVEENIIVELKRERFSLPKEIEQVNEYLKCTNKQLALVLRFTSDGVRYKRVLNRPGYKKVA